MKGYLTDCGDGKVTEREYDYEIVDTESELPDRRKIFRLIDGVTGYESFYIKDAYVKKMIVSGWCANMGTEGEYDHLFFPPDEMRKVMITLGYITGD
jgi:hypothetical protein